MCDCKAEKPLGFILIEDEIRPNVAETFEYFRKNDVAIKVISGDNPAAVSAIAKKAGVPIRIAHSHNTQIDKDYKYIEKLPDKKEIIVEQLGVEEDDVTLESSFMTS